MILPMYAYSVNTHESSVCFMIKSTDSAPMLSKKPIVVKVKYMLARWVVSHSYLFLAQMPTKCHF